MRIVRRSHAACEGKQNGERRNETPHPSALRYPRPMNETTNNVGHLRGLVHFNLANLAKSPSVDIRVHPCCTASAARCASDTRLPSACPSTSKPCSTAQCRSVDEMIRVHG